MNKKDLIVLLENNLENNVSINDIKNELENYICPIDEKNSKFIEEKIGGDDRYKDRLSPVMNELGFKRDEKTNHSIKYIKKVLTEDILKNFIKQVGIENSIQGKRKSVIIAAAKYIKSNEDYFYKALQEGKKELVIELEEKVYQDTGQTRHECSWCSKICKYLDDFLFHNGNYYIYDSNVKNRISQYINYYLKNKFDKTNKFVKNKLEISKNEKGWYLYLYKWLDNIRFEVEDKTGFLIGRSELDHILWGFNKYKVELVRYK